MLEVKNTEGMGLEVFAVPEASTELAPALRKLKPELEVGYCCKQLWLFNLCL